MAGPRSGGVSWRRKLRGGSREPTQDPHEMTLAEHAAHLDSALLGKTIANVAANLRRGEGTERDREILVAVCQVLVEREHNVTRGAPPS